MLALEAQFPDLAFDEVRHPRVESIEDLALAVARARGRPAVMVYTLVEPGLRDEMRRLCRRSRVHYCDLLGHPIDSISRVAGVAARMEPGARAPLDQTYFKRIEAIEFAVRYDDGIGGGLDEADIVLVGVSRTSKTPLSIYLGYLGHKAANVPDRAGGRAATAPVRDRPREDRRLDDRRRAPRRDPRGARALDGRAAAALRGPRGRVRGARGGVTRSTGGFGCPVIDVSELSVEETAMRIIRLVADRHRRGRRRGVTSPNAKYGPLARGIRRDLAEKGGCRSGTG